MNWFHQLVTQKKLWRRDEVSGKIHSDCTGPGSPPGMLLRETQRRCWGWTTPGQDHPSHCGCLWSSLPPPSQCPSCGMVLLVPVILSLNSAVTVGHVGSATQWDAFQLVPTSCCPWWGWCCAPWKEETQHQVISETNKQLRRSRTSTDCQHRSGTMIWKASLPVPEPTRYDTSPLLPQPSF